MQRIVWKDVVLSLVSICECWKLKVILCVFIVGVILIVLWLKRVDQVIYVELIVEGLFDLIGLLLFVGIYSGFIFSYYLDYVVCDCEMVLLFC